MRQAERGFCALLQACVHAGAAFGKAASHDSDQTHNETPRMASACERWAALGLKEAETLGIGS